MPIALNIKCTNGDKFAVTSEKGHSVGDLKQQLETVCQVPVAQQRLIYKGAVLKDDRSLESYSIDDGQTIILVRGSRAPEVAPAPAVAGTRRAVSDVPCCPSTAH